MFITGSVKSKYCISRLNIKRTRIKHEESLKHKHNVNQTRKETLNQTKNRTSLYTCIGRLRIKQKEQKSTYKTRKGLNEDQNKGYKIKPLTQIFDWVGRLMTELSEWWPSCPSLTELFTVRVI